MQKGSLRFLVVAALCLSLFSNCKKKSEEPVTNTSLITKDTWRFSSATIAGADASAQIPACYKDNTADFISDGTGTIDEKANVCSPSVATIFSWSFKNNETTLSMTGSLIPGGTGDFTIELLNETTLRLSQQTTLIPSPTPLFITVTFVH